MQKVTILPQPQSVVYKKGTLDCCGLSICSQEQLLQHTLSKLQPYIHENGVKTSFSLDLTLCNEQYVVDIDTDGIRISASRQRGLHYGALTLVQILKQCDGKLPCLKVDDKPDFATRGLMLDISRGKVPTLDTLREVVDLLSDLKANMLQLYVEGRAFFYPSKSRYYNNPQDYLTAEDVAVIREYAAERFVDLIPCGNCYGHMTYWLNQKEFNHLAHSPNGFDWSQGGLHCPAGTLDAKNPESYDFVSQLFDEMLPCFGDAKLLNIGGDEPFDTLYGDCKLDDDGATYFNYVGKICDNVRSRGLTPMLWGDVAHHHPDKFKQLGDAIFLEWRYEQGQFTDDACDVYKQHNARFFVCPSTAFASTLTGWTDKSLTNIKEAALCGKHNGAEGLLNTEWGDGGYATTRASGVLMEGVGACYAWNAENFCLTDYQNWLNNEVYHADIAEAVADVGRYENYQKQPIHMLPYLFSALYVRGLHCLQVDYNNYSDPLAFFRRDELLTEEECRDVDLLIDSLYKKLKNKQGLYAQETLWSTNLLEWAVAHNRLCLSLRNNNPCVEDAQHAFALGKKCVKEQQKLWYARNKKSDIDLATFRFRRLVEDYDRLICDLIAINR